MTVPTHPNRNPILSAVLAACETERIAAGVRRDGCAAAQIGPVIAILDAMAKTCNDLSSSRYLRIAEQRDKARRTLAYAKVHDRGARGELFGAAYRDALDEVTAQWDKFDAAVAALPEV